jgi:hypothetical protein
MLSLAQYVKSSGLMVLGIISAYWVHDENWQSQDRTLL